MGSEEKLGELLEKADYLLEDANFEEALKFYFFIDQGVKEIDLGPEMRKEYQIYKDSMLLYTTIKECFAILETGQMDLLKERMDFFHETKRALEFEIKSQKLIEFIEKNYHYLLGFYMYNFYKKRFLKEFENVYYFMHAGWIEKATDHYNKHLLEYYNKLVRYGDYKTRDSLYNAIINLNREIKLNTLKQQAYSESASYMFRDLKREFQEEKVQRRMITTQGVETAKFENKDFKKLRELIKHNRPEAAVELYNYIF